MFPPLGMQRRQLNSDVGRVQDTANDLLFNLATIVSLPVEMALRWESGSEYYSPLQIFGATLMMLFLPLLVTIVDFGSQWIPFLGGGVTVGLFGTWALTKLYLVGAAIHTARVCRRIAHPMLEENSWFCGRPLPVFKLLPFGWWTTRIAIEPLFVLLTALTLSNLFVLQSAAYRYLVVAAFALAFKQALDWFSQYQFGRHLLNIDNIGPILGRIVDDKATDDDRAKVNMATLPKDLPEDVRRSVATNMAHAYRPEDR